MARLTNKETKIKLSDTKRYDLQDHKMFAKLSELEDIEEELGIDLITLFKAMKNDIYVKQGEKIIKKEIKDIRCSKGLTAHYELNGKQYDKTGAIMILYGDYNSQYCDFTNVYTYGRVWALTKEELK